jgi:radical SAM enzyme (TIGR01210 family)
MDDIPGAGTANKPTITENPRDLASHVRDLYDRFGQRKEMGNGSNAVDRPHFFLLRTFLGENDLLVILNTKRCRYQCAFCTLPAKSSKTWIPDDQIVAQFRHVAEELRHALSVVDRVTLSNEGSILDETTLGRSALDTVASAIGQMRRVRHLEVETRLEFVDPHRLRDLASLVPRARLGILTGFETVSQRIREHYLKKQQSIDEFLSGLDKAAHANVSLTAYVLFKPDPGMTDQEATIEARESIRFLARECGQREMPLTVRLNPMYLATGSRWAREAEADGSYLPPRLTDVMRIAEEQVAEGVPVYIGLSTEGLAGDKGTYAGREDYRAGLIRHVKLFNDGSIAKFPWNEIDSSSAPHSGVTVS